MLTLADLLKHHDIPVQQDLFDGWVMKVYNKPLNCPHHSRNLNTSCTRHTVTISNDSSWRKVDKEKFDSFRMTNDHWVFNHSCGCWMTSRKLQTFSIVNERCIMNLKLQTQFKDLGVVYPIPLTACPFVSDASLLSIQFREGEYRYLYCIDEDSMDYITQKLAKLTWPYHLHAPPPNVHDTLRLAVHLGTIYVLPFDLNVLILEYLVPSGVLASLREG